MTTAPKIEIYQSHGTDTKVGYRFRFTSLPASNSWIRVVRSEGDWPYGSNSYHIGDFNPVPEIAPGLETRALTALDRLKLEESLPF